jgi:hypothetical protein
MKDDRETNKIHKLMKTLNNKQSFCPSIPKQKYSPSENTYLTKATS